MDVDVSSQRAAFIQRGVRSEEGGVAFCERRRTGGLEGVENENLAINEEYPKQPVGI